MRPWSSHGRQLSTPIGAQLSRIVLAACLAASLAFPSATQAQPHRPRLRIVDSIGGGLAAAALDGDYAYLVSGRRIWFHDLRREAGDSLVGYSEPLDLPVQQVEAFGEHLLVRTGLRGAGGALLIVDRSDPGRPSIVGRLDLPDFPLGLAVHGRAAWLAMGRAGALRVDLTNPQVPRMTGHWRPAQIPGSSTPVGVVDVLDAGSAVLAPHGIDLAGVSAHQRHSRRGLGPRTRDGNRSALPGRPGLLVVVGRPRRASRLRLVGRDRGVELRGPGRSLGRRVCP